MRSRSFASRSASRSRSACSLASLASRTSGDSPHITFSTPSRPIRTYAHGCFFVRFVDVSSSSGISQERSHLTTSFAPSVAFAISPSSHSSRLASKHALSRQRPSDPSATPKRSASTPVRLRHAAQSPVQNFAVSRSRLSRSNDVAISRHVFAPLQRCFATRSCTSTGYVAIRSRTVTSRSVRLFQASASDTSRARRRALDALIPSAAAADSIDSPESRNPLICAASPSGVICSR